MERGRRVTTHVPDPVKNGFEGVILGSLVATIFLFSTVLGAKTWFL